MEKGGSRNSSQVSSAFPPFDPFEEQSDDKEGSRKDGVEHFKVFALRSLSTSRRVTNKENGNPSEKEEKVKTSNGSISAGLEEATEESPRIQASPIVSPSADIDTAAELSALHKIGTDARSLRQQILPVLAELREGKLENWNGISLFDVKSLSLLYYLKNLLYISLLKVTNNSLSSPLANSTLHRLFYHRTVLERIRPLEKQLKYSVDKMLSREEEQGQGNDEDIMKLKPNPMDLVEAIIKNKNQKRNRKDKTKTAGDLAKEEILDWKNEEERRKNNPSQQKEEEEQEEQEEREEQEEDDEIDQEEQEENREETEAPSHSSISSSSYSSSPLYRPPHLVANNLLLRENSDKQHQRRQSKLDSKASSSSFIHSLYNSISDAPEESHYEGDIRGDRSRAELLEEEEKIHFEEENMIRLMETKAEKKKRKERNRSRGEFDDLDDYDDLKAFLRKKNRGKEETNREFEQLTPTIGVKGEGKRKTRQDNNFNRSLPYYNTSSIISSEPRKKKPKQYGSPGKGKVGKGRKGKT